MCQQASGYGYCKISKKLYPDPPSIQRPDLSQLIKCGIIYVEENNSLSEL